MNTQKLALHSVSSPKSQTQDLCFAKYHGAGNAFLLFDNRNGFFPSHNRIWIETICHPKFGIGADGVLLLEPMLKRTNDTDFCLRVLNNDGREANSCGNGLRCFVLFLHHLGYIQPTQYPYRIHVGNRIVDAYFNGKTASINLGAPQKLQLHIRASLPSDAETVLHYVDTGVPHAIQFVENLTHLDVRARGSTLRHHPLFSPHGANIDFVTLCTDGSVKARVFERGVENETLACGTGAAAIAHIVQKLFDKKMPLTIHFPGGTVCIDEQDGALLLSGPAEKICEGSLRYTERESKVDSRSV